MIKTTHQPMMDTPPSYTPDVVVIGAGPVGLFAVFELGMCKLTACVIDSLEDVGGQCTALYPEKPIYDIPAYPKVLAQDLIQNLKEQAAPFNPTYLLGQQVTHLHPLNDQGNSWQVTTSQGITLTTRAIIIAAGVGAFGPNRPPLEGIEAYEGTSVFYYVPSREAFRGKKVVIAGGGDSAVDWAISLAEVAEKVSVVHRRSKFRAALETTDQLERLAAQGAIELVIPYQLAGLEGTDGVLSQVIVESLTGDKKALAADVLLPFFGLSMNLGPIGDWSLGLEKNHIAIDPLTAATNRPGIFAIGDIATYPHKRKLILTGFAEAAQAAHAIRSFLYPDEVIHFEYSTTSGVPGA